MRRFTFLLMLLFLLFTPATANAQQLIAFDSVHISVWPEYDRPDVLVIYDIVLSSATELPTNLNLRIPGDVGQPFAVAMRDSDGQLTYLAYDSQVVGDWLLMSVVTPVPELRIEYYDPHMERQGNLRLFEYTWPGDYPVTTLSLQVQQPINADRMKIDVKQFAAGGREEAQMQMGEGRQGTDGLVYYDSILGELKSGSSIKLSLNYQKPDDVLSFNTQPVKPVQPITQQTAGRTNFMGLVPWLLGALGILLIIGGAFWYWQSGHDRKAAIKRPASTSPAKKRGKTPTPAAANEIYCYQCGKRAAAGDLYCRVCGTRLRVE